MDLHRLHASPAQGKGGNSLDIGRSRWRGEGATHAEKRQVAHRLSVCWNVCEGWRTEDLERGVLREVDELARELVAATLGLAARPAALIADELRAAFERRDQIQDMRDGRPHDCKVCMGSEPVADEEDGDE